MVTRDPRYVGRLGIRDTMGQGGLRSKQSSWSLNFNIDELHVAFTKITITILKSFPVMHCHSHFHFT